MGMRQAICQVGTRHFDMQSDVAVPACARAQDAMTPADREAKPSDADLASLEALAARIEPLWGALSGAAAAIEAELAKSQPEGSGSAAAAAAAAAPSRMLPPGGAQVLLEWAACVCAPLGT